MSLNALRTLRANRSLCAGRTLCAGISFGSLASLGACQSGCAGVSFWSLRTLWTLRPGFSFRPLYTLNALHSLRSLLARWALNSLRTGLAFLSSYNRNTGNILNRSICKLHSTALRHRLSETIKNNMPAAAGSLIIGPIKRHFELLVCIHSNLFDHITGYGRIQILILHLIDQIIEFRDNNLSGNLIENPLHLFCRDTGSIRFSDIPLSVEITFRDFRKPHVFTPYSSLFQRIPVPAHPAKTAH